MKRTQLKTKEYKETRGYQEELEFNKQILN